MNSTKKFLLSPVSNDESRWLSRALRDETFGGALLIGFAVLALIVANSGFSDSYSNLLNEKISIDPLNLNLSVLHWISDGLLAIFFLVAGLELKHELVHGSLAKPSQAIVPVAAAMAGMALPILLYTLVVQGNSQALDGWAIPMATDIAFALAVLALAGKSLPTELRAFLLTVAVVDDLGAISIIAIFYSDKINFQMLLITIILFFLYWLLQKFNFARWYFVVPLSFVIWWSTYKSGIHATVAGVVIGLLTNSHRFENKNFSPAELTEKYIRPISVAVVIPLFAFASAGVNIRSFGLEKTITSQVSLGIIIALFFGKVIGILGATYLVTRLSKASLNPILKWIDILAICFLAGIGFTVSLLIAELSFENSLQLMADAKVGILCASILSSFFAIVVLRIRAKQII